MENRTIVHLTAHYPPSIGGIQGVVKNLVTGLHEHGLKAEVITSNKGSKGAITHDSLNVRRLWSFELAHTVVMPTLFFRLLSIDRDTIVHLHASQILLPEFVYFASKIKGFKYVVHLHGDVDKSGRLGKLFELYKKYILPHVIRSAALVIVLNPEYEIFTHKAYDPLKEVVILPNGIREEFFQDKAGNKSGKNILFVGRLSPEKNVPLLISAMAEVKSGAKLTIVGDGEKRSTIEKMIRQKGLKNVTLVGQKSGLELYSLYKEADIFTLTSTYEGQSLSLLEAMASSTPIIATNVRGIKELVSGIGILVPPDDTHLLAEKIDELVLDPEARQRLAILGRKRAERFSMLSTIDRLIRMYQNV